MYRKQTVTQHVLKKTQLLFQTRFLFVQLQTAQTLACIWVPASVSGFAGLQNKQLVPSECTKFHSWDVKLVYFKHWKFVCNYSNFILSWKWPRRCCIAMATVWTVVRRTMYSRRSVSFLVLVSGHGRRTTAAASRTLFDHLVGGPRQTRR